MAICEVVPGAAIMPELRLAHTGSIYGPLMYTAVGTCGLLGPCYLWAAYMWVA